MIWLILNNKKDHCIALFCLLFFGFKLSKHMIVILDPFDNEVLLASKVFDRPHDPSIPILSLKELISVIEQPDVMIDPENDVDFIYYIKILEENITVIFSAYPLGDHLFASEFVINPIKKYLNDLLKSGLVINFKCSARNGMISPMFSLEY